MHKSLLAKFLTEHQTRTPALLENLAAERATLDAVVARTLDEAASQNRDLTSAETDTLTQAQTRMAAIDTQVATVTSVMETRAAGQNLDQFLQRPPAGPIVPGAGTTQPPAQGRSITLGSFVDGEAYRTWGGRGRSDAETLEINLSQMRAPLTEGATPGSVLLPNPPKIQIPQGMYETPLLDVIGHIPVSTNSIELVVYGDRFGATGAAVVAEGQAKPEATIKASVVPVTVDTVAYWIQATRQLLQDAPAARALIDGQLRQGMLVKVESLVADTIAAGTFQDVSVAGASLLELARMGMAEVQSAGFRPNALVCSPEQAAELDLFLLRNTMAGASFGMPVWGLQIVPVPGITKAYLGDFKTGVQILERTGVDIYVTDSHADTFVKNVFTVLCETRTKPVVTQPNAIVTLTETDA